MLLCSRTTQLQSFTTTKAYYLFFWSSYISIMGQPALRLVEQSLYGASCGSGKENKRMLVSKVPAQIPSADTLLAVTSHMTKSVVYGTGNHNLLWVRQSVEGRGRTGGASVLNNNTFLMYIFIFSPSRSSLKSAIPQNHLDKCSKIDNQGCVLKPYDKGETNWYSRQLP